MSSLRCILYFKKCSLCELIIPNIKTGTAIVMYFFIPRSLSSTDWPFLPSTFPLDKKTINPKHIFKIEIPFTFHAANAITLQKSPVNSPRTWLNMCFFFFLFLIAACDFLLPDIVEIMKLSQVRVRSPIVQAGPSWCDFCLLLITSSHLRPNPVRPAPSLVPGLSRPESKGILPPPLYSPSLSLFLSPHWHILLSGTRCHP